MRVLLDNCVDIRFVDLIRDHEVVHARQRGWAGLSNGNLLASAESAGFEVLVTVDKNLRYQQNFARRALASVTLNSHFVSFKYIAPLAPSLQLELDKGIAPGTVIVLDR